MSSAVKTIRIESDDLPNLIDRRLSANAPPFRVSRACSLVCHGLFAPVANMLSNKARKHLDCLVPGRLENRLY